LVGGRHEASAPVAHAVDDLGLCVLDDDKGGQVLVFCAETVVHPGAERGTAAKDGAGVHLANPAGVVDAVGDAGPQNAQLVRHLGCVRQPIGDPQPALAVLLPLAFVCEQWCATFPHGGDDAAKAIGELLALELLEQGLGVKEIDVARAAFHEEEDHALCLASAVGDFCGLRAAGLAAGITEGAEEVWIAHQ
jgi:hypothetical protein